MTIRTYDFPFAKINIYADGTCRELPKFCISISIERSREYVAKALRQLRRYRAASAA